MRAVSYLLSVAPGVFGALQMSGRVSLHGGLDLVLPSSRPSFVVEGVGFLHKVPAVSLQGTMGVSLIL